MAPWAPTRRRWPEPTAPEVHLFSADLDGAHPGETLLSEDESERASRFRFERDRRRFVAGRSALRRLLGSYLDIAPGEVEFSYGPQGKPRVAESELTFNLAHSGRCALFAFAPGFEVGIDLEMLDQPQVRGDECVAERFFSEFEVATLSAHAPAARPHAFLRCWTRKEAFVKARGDGLSLPLKDFDVAFAAGVQPSVLRTSWSAQEPTEWTLDDISGFCPGGVAALAFRRPEGYAVLKGHIGRSRKEWIGGQTRI